MSLHPAPPAVFPRPTLNGGVDGLCHMLTLTAYTPLSSNAATLCSTGLQTFCNVSSTRFVPFRAS